MLKNVLSLNSTDVQPSRALLLVVVCLFLGYTLTMVNELRDRWTLLIYMCLIFLFVLPLMRNLKTIFLGGFIFLFPIPINKAMGSGLGFYLWLSDIFFLVLIVEWVVRKEKPKIYFSKTNFPALCFIGWSIVSIMNSHNLGLSLVELFRVVKFYLIYLYIANNVQDKREVKIIITLLLLSVTFQSLIGFYQYSTGGGWTRLLVTKAIYSGSISSEVGTQFRIRGTLGNNMLGQFHELILPIALSIILNTSYRKSFHMIVFSLGLAALILTHTRAAYVGFFCAITILFLLSYKLKKISRRSFWNTLIVSMALMTLIIGIFSQSLYTRLTLGKDPLPKRIEQYTAVIPIIKDHPFLGMGVNNWQVVVPAKYRDWGLILASYAGVHNIYLYIASQVGIIGLFFFLWFLFSLLKETLECTRSRDIFLSAVSIGVFAGLIAEYMHMAVVITAYATSVRTLFWILAGLVAGMNRLANRRDSSGYEGDENE